MPVRLASSLTSLGYVKDKTGEKNVVSHFGKRSGLYVEMWIHNPEEGLQSKNAHVSLVLKML